MLRVMVEVMLSSTSASSESYLSRLFRFSRTRSKMTIVELIE